MERDLEADKSTFKAFSRAGPSCSIRAYDYDVDWATTMKN